MSKIFTIDYNRLIVLLLPIALRKARLFGLLKALVTPVDYLYDSFLTNRTANIYKVNQTGQVCYLRGMLNDNFDVTDRRLYVADGASDDWVFTYSDATFNTVDNGEAIYASSASSSATDSLGNITLTFTTDNTGVKEIPKQGYIGSTGIDFAVMVPMALRGTIDENRITALVNYYKLASKRYEIQYFS